MNILFLSSWYPNRTHPHLGNFIQKHAEAVALQSEVAALFVCSDPDCKSMYEIEQYRINNVFTVNVYYKKVSHRIPLISQMQRTWRYLHAHFAGWKIVKNKLVKVDIVHHNILYPAGFFALLLKRLHGYPYLVTEHATEYLPSNAVRFSWIRKIASKMIAKGASCITAVSENLKKTLLLHGFKSHYEIVYNVVDTSLFTPGNNTQSRHGQSKFKLIHISTLKEEQKNISGMLRVIAKLSKQRNDFECLFTGEGDSKEHIQLAKQLNIHNSIVSFEGIKTTEQIAATMKDSDCLFMFSNYENLPVVIVEALACGIPVISSDVGGIAEHINDSNGLLVPAGDEDALLKAFNRMLDNLKENSYSKEALRDYAVENFSYEEVSKKFHHIYSEILDAV